MMDELSGACTPATEVLHFSVDAGLLFELGQRLVGRRSVAVAELIKNSYDADATRAIVSFENVTLPGGRIVITDDGLGMTRQQFEVGWMRIGTDDSRRRPLSALYARPRSGAKGVGRLACLRLARHVQVSTIAVDSLGHKQRLQANLCWDAFAPGDRVESVPIEVSVAPAERGATTGTTLILDQLWESWTQEDIASLRNDLLDLVSPMSPTKSKGQDVGEGDPGFSFAIEVPEYPQVSGDVGADFLKWAWGVLSGTLSDEGKASYNIRLRDDREFSFAPADVEFNRIHGVRFQVYYFVYSGATFGRSGFRLPDARRMGRERGGVRVYLDGFRVFAYGAPGDDWLNLDADRGRRLTTTPDELSHLVADAKRPMLLLPGNMQLFGAVDLSRRDNPEVEIGLSRERFVENEAYTQLRKYVRMGVDWLTVVFARIRAQDESLRPVVEHDDYSVPAGIERVREALSKVVPTIDPEVRKDIDEALTLVADRFRSHEEQRIGELSMLRVLASAGVVVAVLEHTLAGFVAEAEHIQNGMERIRQYVFPEAIVEYDEITQELQSWAAVLREQSSLVGELLARESRTRPRRVAVRPVVERVFQAFSVHGAQFGVDLQNSVSPDTRTPPMYLAEFMSIVVNLVTNAMKAVQTSPIRRVNVTAGREGNGVVLRVLDTGVGIPTELRDEVFEPFFTTSNPDPLLGVGTGLGLTIARDLTRQYGGSIGVVDCEAPWVTCLEVLLPEEGHAA